ncbi:hypothetical protein [Cupriavidus sp. 8B]
MTASPLGNAIILGLQSHLQPKDSRLSLANTNSSLSFTLRIHAIDIVIFFNYLALDTIKNPWLTPLSGVWRTPTTRLAADDRPKLYHELLA